MITAQTPVSYSPALPDQTDVVVIGGGIIGVMTALELAEDGYAVTLLEKGRIAGEQSSRNWGWIRAQGRDIAELPIMLEAQNMWPELAARAGDIGLRQTGTLYLAEDDAEIVRYQAWLDQAAAYQVSSRIMSSDEVAAHLPQASRRWAGALYTPSDYKSEPWKTVPAFACLATKAGAVLVEDCAVRLLDLEGGRVTGVITEKGRIQTQAVVLAGGAWSSLLLRRHGVSIPQLSVRATVAQTEPLPDIGAGGAADGRIAWRRRDDGGYSLAQSDFHELFIGPDAFRALTRFVPQLIKDPFGTRFWPKAPVGYPDAWGTERRWSGDSVSPFEKMRVLDPKPNTAKVTKLARDFSATFPCVGPTQIKHAWAGMIDTLPDVVPIVDSCAQIPGLTICTGMCGHGFGIGPAMGRISAKLATGRATGHDLSRFRLSRFTDGSKLVLEPNL